MSYTLAELANLIGADLVGSPTKRINGVNTLDEATEEDASFLAHPRYKERSQSYYKAMKESKAGVICIDRQTPPEEGKNHLVADDPSRAFQKIIELLHQSGSSAFIGIHPTAVIDSSVQIGKDVTVGPYAVIDRNAIIGDRVKIGAHVFIGAEVHIGADSQIHPSCTIRERCHLGKRVILQSGAVIGSCGFGYTTDPQGIHQKLEQLGNVILEDDVEIGANTTIDRSRFKATVIRRGSKIDNLVQIAHSVEVGPFNLIAAQTGIAGSAKTGRHVMMGGQVGILGHVELEDQVMLATRSGASKSLKTGKYRGSPAIPIPDYNRQEVHIRRIEEYAQRLKTLEQKLKDLEAKQ